jgi:hypothetical protein
MVALAFSGGRMMVMLGIGSLNVQHRADADSEPPPMPADNPGMLTDAEIDGAPMVGAAMHGTGYLT